MRAFPYSVGLALALPFAACGGSDGGGATPGPDGGGDATVADGGLPDAPSGDANGCPTPSPPPPDLSSRLTDRGWVHGATSEGSFAFLGIPYAAPPVGALRWTPPQPHDCFGATLDARQLGSACLQIDPADATGQAVIGSEDCLTLNVWSPVVGAGTSKLPVLVFVHGGGNVQGSSGEQAKDGTRVYDGARLAAKLGAVVVTMNYRLGAMGWLAHPALAAESPNHSAGNYGTLDQIAALQWVQRNVAAFDGDPGSVVVFGQSAGGLDVCVLLASPLAKGLFTSAIIESGGCFANTSAAAAAVAQTYAQKASCDGAADVAACLRALPGDAATRVLPEQANVAGPGVSGFQPNADGWVLHDVPAKVVESGQHNAVPLIVGSNADETALAIVTAFPNGMTEMQYEAAVLAYAGGDQATANRILAAYQASDYGNEPRKAYIAMTTDSKFVCTARYVARIATKGQSAPVFRYDWTHVLDQAPPLVKSYGAWHGQELLFVFRHLDVSGYVPSAAETTLADAIDGYWSRLAATNDPNGGGATAWEPYDVTRDSYLVLDDARQVLYGLRTAECDFWDGLLGR